LPRRPLSGYHRWTQSNRLEAFSDGVLAIIITIMVLESKVPRGVDLAALAPMLPLHNCTCCAVCPEIPPRMRKTEPLRHNRYSDIILFNYQEGFPRGNTP